MVTLKIARFNPRTPTRAGWQSFRVPCLPTDRLLNLLHYVKWYLDGTLTFRRSCAHGVCGSDAMRINGVNRLACKVLMRDLLPKKPGKTADHHDRADPRPAGGEGPGGRHGAVLRRLPRGQAVPDHQRQPADPRADPEPDRPRPLRRHHQVHPVRVLHHQLPGVLERGHATSARRRSSTRTGSSSTAATRPPPSASTSSTRSTASGAAAPRSTAPRPARAASRSPRRSRRSSAR